MLLAVHPFGVQSVSSREGQQLPGELGSRCDGTVDGRQLRTIGHARMKAPKQEQVVADDHQEVVEVVCHAAREPAQSLELLRLPQRVLDPLTLRGLEANTPPDRIRAGRASQRPAAGR